MDPAILSGLDALETGIAGLDAQGATVRMANPAFRTWFPGATPGASADDALTGLDLAALREALAQGRPWRGEAEVRPGRRPKKLEIAVRPHGDGALAEARDISRLAETQALLASFTDLAERRARDLAREKERVEKLLLNLMPRSVYEEFKTFGAVQPQIFDPVSVLMLDFVGFTQMAVSRDPAVTVSELNDLFSGFDRIAEHFGLERIKTLGDSYLAVAGLPYPDPDHARSAARCAERFIRYVAKRNESHETRWRCRVGLASGPVVGSVLGVQKFVYDVFGPAVNLASRLQAMAEPMQALLPATMAPALGDGFAPTDAGMREVRGFGDVRVMALGAEG